MSNPSPNPSSELLSSYGDPYRIMNIFTQFIIVILLGLGAGVIFEISRHKIFMTILLGVSVLPVLVSLYLARRKQLESAVTFLAFILISLITIVVTRGQGIRQISVLAYPAVLIIASLVIRKQTMAFLTLYNIACVAWLFFGEYYGAYTPVVSGRSAPGEFFIATIILGLTTFMVRLLTDALFQNNLHLQKELEERKQAELALQESELKFRSIFDNSVDAIGVSKTGVHIMVNPAYLRMFGYESADQLVGNSILDLIAPSDRPQILDYVRRRAVGESIPNSYETRGLRRDGAEFDMEVHVATYELMGELYTVPILRDISERKEREEQFRYQANLLKNVSDAIIASDLNFKIVSWNQAAETLYGWNASEVIGKPVSEVLRTEYPGESADQARQQFMELGFWKGEVIQNHRDGTHLYILSSVSSVIDENGQPAGAVAVNRDITERRRTEEALRESEERYRIITELVSDYIFRLDIDPNGNAMMGYLSENYEAITGRTLDQIKSTESWSSIIHPEDLGMVTNLLRKIIATRQSAELECRSYGKDGKQRWVRVVARPVADQESSAVSKIVGSVKDITERKRAEQALRESEERYRRLIETSPDAITLTDLGGIIVFCNQQAAQLQGLGRAEEMIGRNAFEFVAPESAQLAIENARKTLETGSVRNIEYTSLKADGTRFPVELSASAILDAEGKPNTFIGVVRDITERKRAENMLRESRTMLKQILDTVPQSIFWKDKDSVYLGCNQVFADAVGISAPEDIIGRTDFDLPWPRREAEAYRADDEYVIASQMPKRHIIEPLRQADGVRLWIDTTKLPLVDSHGNVYGVLGVYEDITERKRAEDSLRLSEERYRTLAQNLPDSALLLFDQELRFVLADGPEIGATGFSREMLEGKTLQEALPPEFAQLVGPNMRRVLAGERFYAELPYEDRFYRYSYVPLRDDTGNIVRAMILATNITHLRKTEEALKDSQRRLSTALRATRVGVWEWDMRTNRAYWSDENYRVMGLEPGNVESRYENWAKCVHPDDLPAAEAKVTEAVNNRSDLNIEFRVVWPDGSIHWINDVGSMLKDEAGQPLGMYGIQMDITERKQLQHELEENRRRLAFLLARSPVVIYSARASGDFGATFVSENVTKIVGYQPEEFTKNSNFWLENIHPDDVDHVNPAIEQLDRNGYHSHEYRFRHAEGHYVWMRDEMTLIRDANGNPLEVIGSWNDITERKRMEDSLFEEKERAEITLQSIGDAVITTGVNALVEYLNPVAEYLTGWKLGEAVGKPLENVFRIIEEASRQPALSPVQRCLQEGKIVGLANHTILISRDGREYAIDDSAAPIRNRNGEMIGVVLVFHDVTEERRLSRQVAHDAMHDSLTGLVNRREFEKRLERALINTKEHQVSHILCYLDLDQFKIVNDTAGHAAGDELLKQISGLLGGLFRQRDTFARLGGDEFGLLLENCQLDQALIISSEIKAKIRDFPFIWAGHGFQVGVSIGVVPITADKESVNQLLSQADIACYSAKDLGRDRIHIYQAEDSETTQRHSEIIQAARMRDAIFHDQFRLFCQPIVQMSGEKSEMPHYEVLLRMTDSEKHLVLPGAFIPSAERYGVMPAIDRWVIRETLLTMARHDIKGMLININLSGNSLDDETLLEYVLEQLDEFSIPPDHICFEITETAAIHHLSKAQQFIHAFRERGGKIALDDFGSGFSSFRYLKTLPVDFIKIDGSFVSDMLSNPGDLLMVEAITRIAHTLAIQVIAEHATNLETINRLREIGVDRAQGFGIGLPVPVEEAWGNIILARERPKRKKRRL